MLNGNAPRNRIVVHFKNGKVLRGHTHDFTPLKDSFHLAVEGNEGNGKIKDVNLADLKAVFFVKSLTGNRDYVEKKTFDDVDGNNLKGIKIKVEFLDGEIIRGVSLGYNKNRKGFFLIPVDGECNNERIFVISDAARDIAVGKLAEE